MLKLKQLTFNNIRCFDTEQTVNFVERDRLIQVDGRNDNTGGSSGAGKTTVFLALDYLLGINDIPTTSLQSRLTKAPIEVTGVFQKLDKEIIITRSKKTGLTVKIGEETVSGNVKLAEEKLSEIIGIPKKIFKKMVHKKQKEGGFFLNMTSKEIYEFLITMLGLDQYIKQADTITDNIKTYIKKLEDLNIEISNKESNLSTLNKIIEDKVRPSTQIKREDIETLEKSITKYEQDISTLKIQKSGELDKVQKVNQKFEGFNTAFLESLQEQIKNTQDKRFEIEKARKSIDYQLVNITTLKNNAGNTAHDIKKLNDKKSKIEHEAMCPTCKREWTGESAQIEINTIKDSIAEMTSQVLTFKKEIEKEPEYLQQIDRLKNISVDVSGKLDHLKKEEAIESVKKDNHKKMQDDIYQVGLASYNNEIAEIKAKFESPVNELKQKWENCTSQYNTISSEYAQYNKSLKIYEEEKSKIIKMIDNDTVKIEDLTKNKDTVSKKILVAEESKRLVKSYMLQVFQETLDLIGDTATEILSGIPNMNTSTIYFEGCKENKNGSIKDEVNAVIGMDGVDAIPIKSLSGGERTAIDLSVDLAVVDVIETKTGKGADFFVLDEPFDGLDAICKENCLEILKQIDTNKKIIIVDHSSELKEMVSDTITVVKNGESSSILV